MANLDGKDDDMNALAKTFPPLPLEDAQSVAPAPVALDVRELIRVALNNPDYFWRTAEGIAHEVNLSPIVVGYYLDEIAESLIVSAVPDSQGRTRYTTLEHYRAHAGILRRVLD